jgi:diaminopimelate dehydrogenase
MAIRLGIFGYGNLGKGIETALNANKDMELKYVFTRRDPNTLSLKNKAAKVISANDVFNYQSQIDILILCGGSATDLPEQTPKLARCFNVIDSFDTHARIPEHFANVDAAARQTRHLALISAGWDPGMFSLMRLYGNAILPQGTDYTFWGKGVSQGHSDAIRRVEGVSDARQYTCPVDSALEAVRSGKDPVLTTRQKHTRLCYVVLKEGADKNLVEQQIKNMPNYFADYDTTVNFISQEELERDHMKLPHGGFVIRSGVTGDNNHHVIEYSLKLDSNPEFTASVILAYARAVSRLHYEQVYGCKTVFDIAPSYLSPLSHEEIIKTML